ncbi:MAG: pilus assembly protein PilM [Planctomycetes bacterium]|nr:pilus assembly protein PilM [Planctomycetota bacterium]
MPVGIEIGSRTIKVARLRGGRRPRLLDFVVETIPDPAEDQSPEAALSAAIADIFKRRKLPRGEVVACLSPHECVVRDHSVPFTRADQIARTIKFQAEGFFHDTPIDEAVVDWYQEEEHEGRSRLLVVGARKDRVAARLELLAGAGIDPMALDLDATAEFNAYFQTGALAREGTTAVVDIGNRYVKLLVAVDGRLRTVRGFRASVPAGDWDARGAEATAEEGEGTGEEAVAEPVEDPEDVLLAIESGRLPVVVLDEEDAARLGPLAQVEAGAASSTAVVAGVPADPRGRFLSRLGVELDRTLAAAGVGGVARILVTGGGSRIDGLEEGLASGRGAEVLRVDLARALDARGSVGQALNLQGAAAVGCALKAAGLDAVGLDLRREQYAYQRRIDVYKRGLATTLTLLALMAFLLGSAFQVDVQRLRYERDRLLVRYQRTIWDDLFPGIEPSRAVDIPHSIKTRMEEMGERLGNKQGVEVTSVLEVLKELAAAKNASGLDFEISSLNVGQEKTTLTGWSTGNFSPGPFVDRITRGGKLEARMSDFKRQNDRYTFEVTAERPKAK